MRDLIELDRSLSEEILDGCWKFSIIGMIIGLLVTLSPFTKGNINQAIYVIIILTLSFGIMTYFYKHSPKVNYLKYYVNFILIFMILSMAIIWKNPEIFSLFYFIMAINMSYRDRVLHFLSSGFQLINYIGATIIFPFLLPAATGDDSSISLMVTRITIFVMVVFFVDILNNYNRQLTSNLEKKEKEITVAAITDSVGALIQALEAKDLYTIGHAQRTSKYAVAIAEQLEIPFNKEQFITGCLLHDIGKIGLPDSILLKIGPLTKEEFMLIKNHPTVGAKILENTNSLRNLIPMVLYHHERYDGNGYPLGLKGEEIPAEARILAVADSYDAMTSNRPYRNALTHNQALQEIISNAGKQFCPNAVEAFVNIYGNLHIPKGKKQSKLEEKLAREIIDEQLA